MIRTRQVGIFLFSLLFTFLFFGCQTTSLLLKEKYTDPQVLSEEELLPPEIVWTPLEVNGNSGASFCKDDDGNTIDDANESAGEAVDRISDAKNPQVPTFQIINHKIKSENVEWTCVKINLDEPNLEIVAKPSRQDLGKRFFLKNFAQKTKSIVAVNTVPSDMDPKSYLPVSVVKIDGEIICPVNSSYSALAFSQNPLRAKIIKNQNEDDIADCDYAFGGFFTILEDGDIYEFAKYKSSRTAVGFANGGRELYLFATCGINCPTGRNGLNFEECAVILKALGCTDAMEFDGGHSTGLAIQGENAIRPGLQRKVPAAFGIRYRR